MENNSSKLNTVLLIILVVLAAACLIVLLTQRTDRRAPVQNGFQEMNYSGQNMQNGMMAGSQMQTSGATANNQTVSQNPKNLLAAYGMSVSLPTGQGYTSNTSAPRALSGVAQVLNVVKNNAVVATLTKFSSRSLFLDSTPSNSSDWVLVNANYSVNGIAAQYYERAANGKSGETLVVVPSKMITIYVATDDSLTAEILSSVGIN